MHWVRPWLGCLAMLYPAWWLATLVVRELPALWGRQPAWMTPLVALAIGGAVLAVRRWPAFVGLLVTANGVMLLLGPRRGFRPLAFAAGALLIACGLRRLLRVVPGRHYAGRVLFLVAVVVVPVAAAPVFRSWQPSLVVAGAAILASLRRHRRDPQPPGWPTILAGATATLLIVALTPVVSRRIEEKRKSDMAATLAALPAIPAGSPYPRTFFQRGVNFTAEFPAGYTSTMSRDTLRMLPAYGINAIALVPYGNISSPRRFGGGWESDDGIEMLSRVAHSIGVKVMLKPQLWGRTWPADYQPASEDDRRRWFDEYALMVDHYARLATRIHADLFCIGTELARMTPHQNEWRALIQRARAAYKGPITYAAIQGPEFETLAFWDALDYIAISNYYPLPDNLDTAAVAAIIEAVQRRFSKPLIFAEAGFASFEAPHRAPWDETPRRLAPEDQARCYEALFRAFYSKPWFQGVYWWKVGTNRYGGVEDGSHTPWGKPAMEVMKRWYTSGRR